MLISEQILARAGIEVLGEWDEFLPRVSIHSHDSVGGLFWALPGASGHGETYVQDAFGRGAKMVAVTSRYAQAHGAELSGHTILVMEETLSGLQKLATEVRRSIGSKVIALTGSNGKTTTRELLAAALSTSGKTASGQGNYNNHIGVPITLLNMEGNEEYAVVEMGANHPGEIARLCEIAHPEAGLITNIGDAHLGEFGGPDALQRAKGELFRFLETVDGLAVVNLDDDRVTAEAHDVKTAVGYTLGEVPGGWRKTVYQGRIVEQDIWSRTTLEVEGMRVKLQLPGRHWASSALAAYTAAVEMGAEFSQAFEALGTVKPLSGRGIVYDLGNDVELLDDSYNANGASIRVALETLAERPGKKIAVFGDMLELGEYEETEHRKVGALKKLAAIDVLFFVGERMKWAAEEARAAGHGNVEVVAGTEIDALAEQVEKNLEPGTGIVVKGSRKTGLDAVVRKLFALRGVTSEERA